MILAWGEESFFGITQQTNAFGQTFHVHDPSGMMAAFAKLADPSATVEISKLALDIQFALITTAMGW